MSCQSAEQLEQAQAQSDSTQIESERSGDD